MPRRPLLCLLLCACAPPSLPLKESGALPSTHATADSPFEPLPEAPALDPRRVALGAKLFEDPRMSGGSDRACADCHQLDQGGVAPGEQRSDHPLDAGGPYNVPTVFNASLNFRLNWRGKAKNLDEHFSSLMMKPEVMNAGSWEGLSQRLSPYRSEFVAAGLPAGPDEHSIRAVMVDYQRSLLTPDAPFDRFLRQEETLSEQEMQGYDLFKSLGCASCHQGVNVGGNLFQRFGIHGDAFEGQETTKYDRGRAFDTNDPADERVFRVPSLRNVAVTAPYFHNGSAPTLDVAVRRMGRLQLGYELSDPEADAIVAFLGTLTGEYQGVPLDADLP